MTMQSAQASITAPGYPSREFPLPALEVLFTVGEWRVQPARNRLLHLDSDLERQLEPRLVQLLCFLAANAGEVINRDDLVSELWPRVIVNENSLTRAVSELRKQLALPGSARQYIETIPKKGYRLLADVEIPQSETTSHRSGALKLIPSGGKSPVVAALALSLAMGAWVLGLSPQEAGGLEEFPVFSDELIAAEPAFAGGEVRLSRAGEHEQGLRETEKPVLANDGARYAYIQYDSAGSTIYLGDLEKMDEPRPVYASQANLYNLAWSPLGDALLFARRPITAIGALYNAKPQNPELVMLDLKTLQTHRLTEERDIPPGLAPELNLT